jgi:hypothetical protein
MNINSKSFLILFHDDESQEIGIKLPGEKFTLKNIVHFFKKPNLIKYQIGYFENDILKQKISFQDAIRMIKLSTL